MSKAGVPGKQNPWAESTGMPVPSPLISPASERVRGGKQAAVQKAGVECFVLHFLSVSSFLFPCMSHSCSTDLFPLHVVKQK